MTPWDEAAPNKTQLDLVLQRKKKGNCWRGPHVICIDWYLMCFQQLCKLTQYVKLGTSQLSLFQEQRKRLICWDKNFILWGELVFFLSFKHLNICGWCHKCVFMCSFIWCHCLKYVKAFAQPRPAALFRTVYFLATWAVYSPSVRGALPVLIPTDSLCHWELLEISPW